MSGLCSPFFYVMNLAFFVMGAALTGWYVYTFWQAAASRHWPTTSGTITQAEVQEVLSIARMPLAVKAKRAFYLLVIKYRYTVNGKTYEGYRVTPSGVVVLRHAAAVDAVLSRYAPESRVTVHYCPQRPEIAVLETGHPSPAVLVLGVMMFVALAVALDVWASGIECF